MNWSGILITINDSLLTVGLLEQTHSKIVFPHKSANAIFWPPLLVSQQLPKRITVDDLVTCAVDVKQKCNPFLLVTSMCPEVARIRSPAKIVKQFDRLRGEVILKSMLASAN